MPASKKDDFVKPRDDGGCTITIEASPGAKTTEVTGVNRWRGALQVRIAAEAREGAANQELLRFLSDELDVPRNRIVMMQGERSSLKVIYVPVKAAKAIEILGGKDAHA